MELRIGRLFAVVYVAADTPPWFQVNRIGNGRKTIGGAVRVGRRRVLSIGRIA